MKKPSHSYVCNNIIKLLILSCFIILCFFQEAVAGSNKDGLKDIVFGVCKHTSESNE